MSGTQQNLPSINAEPESWQDESEAWLSRPAWAIAAAATIAVWGGFWWLTGDPVVAVVVTAAALVSTVVIPAAIWCWAQIRELRRRTVVLSQQAVSDRLDHWELVSTVRNSRMDELTRRRAERERVPQQRSEEST